MNDFNLITSGWFEIKKSQEEEYKRSCSNCGISIFYKNKSSLECVLYQIKKRTHLGLCNLCVSNHKKTIIPKGGWYKHCPDCNKKQTYSTNGSLKKAVKENRKCKHCIRKGIPPTDFTIQQAIKSNTKHIYPLMRICSKCGRKIEYFDAGHFHDANRKNTVCYMCVNVGRPCSEETKAKKRLIKVSDETKRKISKKLKGHTVTDEQKEKLRIATIQRIKRNGREISYNHKACEFINNLNKEKGWNLQHAENGGEVEIIGYSLDGYDKEKNIIFEYDEPYHHQSSVKQKHFTRQKRLIGKLKPTMFLRYDERNKRLYDVITQEEIAT